MHTRLTGHHSPDGNTARGRATEMSESCTRKSTRAVLNAKKKKRTFVTPTETNVHGGSVCFLVMGPSVLQRLAVGSWWWLAAVGGWRLVTVGGWRLVAFGGGWRLAGSLGAVLNCCP